MFGSDIAMADDDLTLTNALTGADRSAAETPAAAPGWIGNYRLIRKLGQGGMGTVFEAEQQRPQRSVALKVVSGGAFASVDFLRLFEREISALARLKHPGIASIYEAGQTDDGQRFFTMELVAGETLAEYLARKPLPARELLQLFLSICEAVTYAHQRGVIHRDLKPSNIMVHEEGGVPAVKVLDFGLARINDENAPAPVTQVGTIRGTLAYMSPEQVRGNPEEIDIRADVYALGAILYEALSGRLPHDPGRVTIHEAARIICEEPPERLEKVSLRRGRADADLCTIVHTAIEKDASRRYASVSALAEDIVRYLGSQPIQARPPSTIYQVRKLVARHRLAFGFAATVLVLVVAFAIAVAVQARRIALERDRANQQAETSQQVSSFLTGLFGISNPSRARGNAVTAREILDKGAEKIQAELKGQPEVRASLLYTMSEAYDGLGLFPEARKLAEEALEIRRKRFGPRNLDVALTLERLATTAANQGELAAAIAYDRQALEIRRALLGNEDLRVAESLTSLGTTLYSKGDLQESIQLLREALAISRKLEGPDGTHTSNATQQLGMAVLKARDYAAAEPLLRDAIRQYELHEGETSVDLASTLNDLGNLLSMRGDLAGAESAYRRSRAISARIFGPNHPNTAILDENLAMNLRRQRRYEEAEKLVRDAMARFVKALGDQHPRYSVFLEGLGDVLRDRGDLKGAGEIYRRAMEFDLRNPKGTGTHVSVSYTRLGDLLTRMGDPAAGEPLLHKGLEIVEKSQGPGSPEVAEYQGQLGTCLAKLGRFQEAEPLLIASYQTTEHTLGATHTETKQARTALADLYAAWGRPEESAKYRR
jgi:tetratricopeptide (TPR) repeat protein